MIVDSVFSALLQWLASATGDEAKDAGVVRTLDFPMPASAPTIMQLSETRPVSRRCCTLGGSTSPSLDPATLWQEPHQYNTSQLPGGGETGYVYTRYGGFIDFGHARDFIDMTRYFTQKYRDAASLPVHRNGLPLFNEGADIVLLAEQVTPKPDYAICALIGAKLAFEYSVWHEIVSYFPQSGSIDEKYSAFAPEDLFSNAVGVVAGFRTLFNTTVEFDVAADQTLREVLEFLGPVAKETTEAATQYVKGRWWKQSLSSLNPFSEAARRNFLSAGAIKPWLITDLAISGRESATAELAKAIGKPQAASITISTHYNGVFLDGRAHLLFRNPLPEIKSLVPAISEIRSIDLRTVTDRLRDLARIQEGTVIDQP
jgi:hypothetical protein